MSSTVLGLGTRLGWGLCFERAGGTACVPPCEQDPADAEPPPTPSRVPVTPQEIAPAREGRGQGHAGSAAPGCRQGQERTRASVDGTGTCTEGREGPASRASSCGWVHPLAGTRKGAARGRDVLGTGHIVTRSSINPIGLCLHNSKCFGCFMETDKSRAGDGKARARLRDACPTPALPSQPIKVFYFKRDTDFIAAPFTRVQTVRGNLLLRDVSPPVANPVGESY